MMFDMSCDIKYDITHEVIHWKFPENNGDKKYCIYSHILCTFFFKFSEKLNF